MRAIRCLAFSFYLCLSLSLLLQVYDNVLNFQEDLCDCDFFECIELDAALPGPPLVVEVMDKDDWTADDLIGRTVIDLEDRWFDATWQALGQQTKCDTPGKVRVGSRGQDARTLACVYGGG